MQLSAWGLMRKLTVTKLVILFIRSLTVCFLEQVLYEEPREEKSQVKIIGASAST
jgi:hypothetical protein